MDCVRVLVCKCVFARNCECACVFVCVCACVIVWSVFACLRLLLCHKVRACICL